MEAATPQDVTARIGDWRISNENHKAGRPLEYRSHRLGDKNLAVTQRWAERWINNAAANVPVMKRASGLDILRSATRGLHVVCVGVGPSLDYFLPYAEHVAKRCIILATDAALAPLLSVGVQPDLVVNFDCRDEQATMWERIAGAPGLENLVLLANTCAAPGQLAAWPGKLMGFNMAQGDDEFVTNVLPTLFPDLGTLPNLGTVGNSLLILASLMEAAKIYAVGYDFCYGPILKVPRPDSLPEGWVEEVPSSWRYRSDDFFWAAAEDDLPARFAKKENAILYDNAERLAGSIEVELDGKKVKTDEALWNYRRIMLDTVGQLDLPVVNVGSPTLGKLETMSLQQFLVALNDVPQMTPGMSVVPHLATLLQVDPRTGLFWDAGTRMWREVPPAAPPATRKAEVELHEVHP